MQLYVTYIEYEEKIYEKYLSVDAVTFGICGSLAIFSTSFIKKRLFRDISCNFLTLPVPIPDEEKKLN